MHFPPLLAPGARVALVAPAGPLGAKGDLKRAVESAHSFGWEVWVGDHVQSRKGYLAGSDAERLSDLNTAIQSDRIDGIWCIRGGYGVMRLLERIDYESLRRRPKALLGYSDVTALHSALITQCELVSFHAPTARSRLTDFARESLCGAVVDGADPCGQAPRARTLYPGRARGRLVGGNLSLLAALGISTVVQMVIGELAPKNIAIARPLGTALLVAPLVRAYNVVFGPLIWVFDSAANTVTRWLGFEPRDEVLAGYTPDELARIVEESSEQLTEQQTELLLRAVELGDRRVSEVMVPRPDVVWVQADDPVSAVRDASRQTGFSRFPVAGTSEDDVVGTVHIKDLLHVDAAERDTLTVREIADDAQIVPESHSLRRLLSDLRQRRRTFAVVVDEYGDVAGVITLEDVLEELVGEIEDEFDLEAPALRRIGAGRFVIPGRLRIGRLEELLEVDVPDGEYDTVAGFVIAELGHIPTAGESVRLGPWRFVVMGVEGNRIVEILLERAGEAPAATEAET
jgi:CBS domain containing-hemolysin-like protein